MKVMIDKCPKCGSTDAYYYRVHGVYLEYLGLFGRGKESEEFTEVGYYKTSTRPKFAKCGKCGKLISLKDLRGE